VAKKFFSIPLGNLPALVEMQNLLRRRLPEGTTYNDPATFHMTLVFVEDDKGIDLMFDDIARGLPVFGVSGDYMTTLGGDENRGLAVVLRVERNPQLIYLQSSIYYNTQARGATISQYSYPARWRAHITLANLPLSADRMSPYAPDTYIDSPVHMQVDRIAITEEGSFEPVKEWPLLLDVPVQEFMEQLEPNVQAPNPKIQLQEQSETTGERIQVELTCVSEMKGGIPNLKLPDDIDTAAIQAKGFKFVTLPLGQVDARSRNGRNYRRPAYQEMVEQINANRPEGGWGHIKDEDMGTSYAPPAIRWLRAEMTKDGTIWGKGLPLTAEANDYFELARATNSRVGTSLHAWVDMKDEDVMGMELIRLDLADPARVGVAMTAAQPQLSTEMQTSEDGTQSRTEQSGATASPQQESTTGEESETQASSNQVPEESTMPDEKRVLELEQERRNLQEQHSTLERSVKEQRAKIEDAADVYKILGITATESMDIIRAARALKEQYDDMVAENTALLKDTISAIVKDKVAIESVRPIIAKMVADQKPATKRQLDRAFEQVMSDAVVKELIAAKMASESGPNQPPPQGQSNQSTSPAKSVSDYFDMPEGVTL